MKAQASHLEHAARLAMAYHPPRSEPVAHAFNLYAIIGSLVAAVALAAYALLA